MAQVATQLTKVVKFKPIFIESKFQWEVRGWPDMDDMALESSKIEIPEINAHWWIAITPKILLNHDGHESSYRTIFNFNLKMHSESWKHCKYEFEALCFEPRKTLKERQTIFYFNFKPIDQDLMVSTSNTQLNFTSSSSSVSSSKSFEIKVTIKFLGSQVVRNKTLDPFAASKEILTSVRGLFGNPVFADFTFIVKNKEFKVHRNILGAASSVLTNMFTSNMEESRTNRCKLDHFEADVFEMFLEYIYKGSIPAEIGDSARDLYAVADYYGIDRLKDAAKSEVAERLNVANAVETYKWASQYDLEEIKTDSWEIVKREVLKIFFPLKFEPLTYDEIQDIIIEKRRHDAFWRNFRA